MRIVACATALLLAACSASTTPPPAATVGATFEPVPKGAVALRLHGFRESLEIAPVLLAADKYYPQGIAIRRGGIPNLIGASSTPGYGDEGVADIATHAETQLLRYSLDNPQLRVIMTVTEGDYRIVARRSAGIAQLADLRGKRVAVLPNTSSAYFLQRMLETVGMAMNDVELVGDLDLADMGEALGRGDIDALAIWEPEAEEGALALGPDAVEISGRGVYREIFNLNTTAGNLADPDKRMRIKQFLGAIIEAADEIERDPRRAQQLVGQMSGHSPQIIAAAWPHHTYLAGKAPDLLDVLVAEERWLAESQGRAPRSREQLAQLIDYTLLDEVLAARGARR